MTQELATPYILFEVAGTRYAVKSSDVQHLEMLEHITPVPNAPAFVEGVVFSRGQVIPVVSLRKRFGLPPEANTPRTRLIVVKLNNRQIGMIADAAKEFRNIASDAIQPPHSAIELSERFLSGIATIDEQLVFVLDLNTTLNIGNTDITRTPARQAA